MNPATREEPMASNPITQPTIRQHLEPMFKEHGMPEHRWVDPKKIIAMNRYAFLIVN